MAAQGCKGGKVFRKILPTDSCLGSEGGREEEEEEEEEEKKSPALTGDLNE
jgi:hypothetical protein